MKKKLTWDLFAGALVTVAAIAFCVAYLIVWYQFDGRLKGLAEREAEYEKLSQIRAYVEEYYITDFDPQTMMDGAATGYVNALPDEWSYYMTAAEYADYVDTTKDDYAGIGISGSYDEQYGGIRVFEIYSDSPAQRAGIAFFDLIIGVEGESVHQMGFEKSIDAIRGEAGTSVMLTLLRASDGATYEVSVTRENITDQELQYELLDGGIGYIRIKGFDERVDLQFVNALNKLLEQGAQGFVFDVRFNPGGRVDVLTNMLDPLLPEGVIIESRDKNGGVKTIRSDAAALSVPMAVLTHEYSISAAEFFAAALQESGQAAVVGTHTLGKGYSQNTIPLQDGSALVLSTAQYFTQSGRNLAGSGITPDYYVPLTDEQLYTLRLISHEEDPQLQKALEVVQKQIVS